MTDVFISYDMGSRPLAIRLREVLEKHGKTVWVDWQGLRPSDKWLDEIFRAIEAAHTVVLIVTPQFLVSKNCNAETKLAADLNKQIVPLLNTEVDRSELPLVITERHWILWKDGSDFDAAASSLVDAIDIDRDWVRSHTRLLTRALEWERNNHDPSFTLRGRDLQNAELALTLEKNQKPHLVPLQVEYILRSRQDVNRRYRIGLGASALAVMTIAIFGLLLWQQRHEQTLTLASSIREKGIYALGANDALAAELLFAHAFNINDAGGSRESLLEARARSPKLVWSSPATPGRSILSISDDGRYFVAARERSIEIWDSDTRQKIRELPGTGYQLGAFDPRSFTLALSRGREIDYWDLNSSRESRPKRILAAVNVTSMRLASGGVRLIAGGITGNIFVWNLLDADTVPQMELRGHTDRVTSLATTKDGRLLISGSWDDKVGVWDLESGRRVAYLSGHDDSILAVALNGNEDLVASAGWDTTIIIWDLKTGRALRELSGHRGAILNLMFSPGRNFLVSTSEDRTARLWDVDKGRPVLTLAGHGRDVAFVGYRDSGATQEITTGDLGGNVRVWDLEAIGHRDEFRTLRGHAAAVTMFDFHPQRPWLISSSVDATLRLWDWQAQKTLRTIKQSNRISSVRFSPDGRQFAATPKGDAIQVWDLESGSATALGAEYSNDGFRYLAYSPDSSLVAAGSDNGMLRVWEVKTGKLKASFVAHSDKIQGLAFSPDGKLLASSADDSGVKLWSTQDWKLVWDMLGHGSGVYQISFSRDGKTLISASDDKTARLWNVATGKQLGAPLMHDSPVWTADFSPDGKFVATGSDDATVRVWTLREQRGEYSLLPYSVLKLTDGPVWWLAFHQGKDGLQLAIGGQDRTIRLLNMSFLEGMGDRAAALEQEAEQRGGQAIQMRGGEITLVPLSDLTNPGSYQLVPEITGVPYKLMK
jgi:WD40 repeat protein